MRKISSIIVHRDVKMQNILLKDNYQTLVLTDYGTATQLGKSWMTDNVGTPSKSRLQFERNIFKDIFSYHGTGSICL